MDHHSPFVLLPALLFAALFVWYTRRKNALTTGGALAAACTGLWVLWWAGPLWLLPLFFFFISSTLLGRLAKGRSVAADTKHGQARDYRQVLCNGGIYAALATQAAVPNPAPVLTLMALSLSVSTADTWSSETGQYFRQKTLDILRWRPVPVGLSGGVSAAGTLGGLAGALVMALLCSSLLFRCLQPKFVLLVSVAGFAGMLLDSVLGAGLQARFRDATTCAFSDQAGDNRPLYSGFSWMSNDAVNLWSNAVATFAGYCLVEFG